MSHLCGTIPTIRHNRIDPASHSKYKKPTEWTQDAGSKSCMCDGALAREVNELRFLVVVVMDAPEGYPRPMAFFCLSQPCRAHVQLYIYESTLTREFSDRKKKEKRKRFII